MDNTTQEVEDFLRTHNIPFKALNHLPITTCEEGLKIAKEFGSTCCKTLLVKNKKQFFLFVIPGEERFNAKQAAAFLKSSLVMSCSCAAPMAMAGRLTSLKESIWSLLPVALV